MGIVSTIFTALGEIITGLVTLIGNLFAGVTEIFYVAGTEGASGELTFIGILMLIGVGMGLFWLGFNFIRSLIKMRG